MVRLATIISLVCALGLFGCDQGTDRQSTRVSPWIVERTLQMGSVASGDDVFGSLGHVLIAASGDLYISESMESRIRVYSSSGTMKTTIGREGSGPGEFHGIWRMGILGDSLFVTDTGHDRVSFFSLDGDFLGSRPWATPRSETGIAGAIYSSTPPSALLRDGTAVVEPSVGLSLPANFWEAGVISWTLPRLIVHVDETGIILDTIAAFQQHTFNIRMADGAAFPNPLSDFPLAELIPGGKGVVMVERSAPEGPATAAFQVSSISSAGDTLFSTLLPFQPLRATQESVEIALRRQDASESADLPSWTDRKSALRREGLLPNFLPPVNDLAVGQDGSIWIQRESLVPDSTRWQVLNEQGVQIGAIWLPTAERVVAADRNVLVTTALSDLGVPLLYRYSIAR